MKKFFVLIGIMLTTFIGYTQIAEEVKIIEATSSSYKFGDDDWTEWKDLDESVKIMYNNSHLIVYEDEVLHFTLYTPLQDTVIDGTKLLMARALNDEEIDCNLYFALRENDQIEFHIDYAFSFCYLVKQTKEIIFKD